MGYLLAKDILGIKTKAEIMVHLVVPSVPLAMLYKEKFKKKVSQADARIKIIWVDLGYFKEKWLDNPDMYDKHVVVVDEGDQLLLREISHNQ